MPILQHTATFDRLAPEDLANWRAVPPAVASDCMNRTGVMAASMKPLGPGMTLCGQARTVQCMVGDNSPVHAAIRILGPGEVLVVDAGGHPGNAVFGGLLAREMMGLKAGGIIVDGAVRDSAEIVALGFPTFASFIVPRGPHTGFGGTLDGVIACAGCPIVPGDIVLGDDDGVAVVPLAQAAQVLEASLAKLATEQDWLRRIEAGENFADHLGIPAPRVVP